MTRVGLTWADDEGQGDTREDVLFNSNDEWIKGEERRGGSPRAIAAEPGTRCVPPAPSLFWKQTAVRGFSPRRSFISLTATTSPSCVVNTHQRGGLLLTKQTEEEFHFDGDLYGERQATVRSAPRYVFVTSEVDDEARKQRALINLHSNTVCLFFFSFPRILRVHMYVEIPNSLWNGPDIQSAMADTSQPQSEWSAGRTIMYLSNVMDKVIFHFPREQVAKNQNNFGARWYSQSSIHPWY